MIALISGSPLPIVIPYLLKAEALIKGTEYGICSIVQIFAFEKVRKKNPTKLLMAEKGKTWE